MVFVRHAPPFTKATQPVLHLVAILCQGGGFGVDVFFVLSAYLITEILRREKLATGTLDLKAFYMRRILRIWPLYYVFLFVAAYFTRNSPVRLPSGALIAFCLLAGNWFSTRGFLEGPIFPLWSVSIEEQFYLVWPVLLKHLRREQIMRLCWSLIAIAILVKTYLLAHHASLPAIYCNTFARMDTIAAGVLIAYLLNGRVPLLGDTIRVALLVLALGLIYIAVVPLDTFYATSIANGVLGYVCGLLAALALFFAFLGALSQGLPSLLQPLRYLGRISYGLYVFHVLAISLWAPPHFSTLRTLPAVLTTIVFAWISYELLEKPFLRLKGRFTKVRSVPLAA